MLLDGAQLLSHGLAVPLVLKTVVVVHVEAHILVPVGRHAAPLLQHLICRPLEERQHHGHAAVVHASAADDVHGPVVERAEGTCGNVGGRLVAHLDSGHHFATAVSPCQDLQRMERLLKTPVPPAPSAERSLPATARRLGRLATGGSMEVQNNLQPILLCPFQSAIDVLQRWPSVGFPSGGTEHYPVTKGQTNCIEATIADSLKVPLGDVRLPVLPDVTEGMLLPQGEHQVPLA
mmetsp:Transcript_56326/g.175100  ORF Transcript_56326/g.175100 Transcript_56326/m.175100 type:complete len:234 (+) Transcript_56326:1107-1808(+)